MGEPTSEGLAPSYNLPPFAEKLFPGEWQQDPEIHLV